MTPDIKELLELAAKAAGLELDKFSYVEKPNTPAYFTAKNYVGRWNPATDDGDGARMEASLMIDVIWAYGCVAARVSGMPDSVEAYKEYPNKQAARRMASLRLAAEVGRRMKDD